MASTPSSVVYIAPLSPVQPVWLVAADGSVDGPHPAAAIAHRVEPDDQLPAIAAVLVLAQRAIWTDAADTFFDQPTANHVGRTRSAQPITEPATAPAGPLTMASLSRKS